MARYGWAMTAVPAGGAGPGGRGARERVERLGKRRGRIVPFLFPRSKGRFAGQRRRGFAKVWRTACEDAAVLSDADLQEAALKLTGTISGTVAAVVLDTPRANPQNS